MPKHRYICAGLLELKITRRTKNEPMNEKGQKSIIKFELHGAPHYQ
jgi:hypothetical protein